MHSQKKRSFLRRALLQTRAALHRCCGVSHRGGEEARHRFASHDSSFLEGRRCNHCLASWLVGVLLLLCLALLVVLLTLLVFTSASAAARYGWGMPTLIGEYSVVGRVFETLFDRQSVQPLTPLPTATAASGSASWTELLGEHRDILRQLLVQLGDVEFEALFPPGALIRVDRMADFVSLLHTIDVSLGTARVQFLRLVEFLKVVTDETTVHQPADDWAMGNWSANSAGSSDHLISEDTYASEASLAARRRMTHFRMHTLGYTRATGISYPEAEVLQPMDELELLMYRHYWNTKELQPSGCREYVNTTCLQDRYQQIQLKRLLLRMPSVLNRRYYYPMRRWERMQPFASMDTHTADAIHTALVTEAEYYTSASAEPSAAAKANGLLPHKRGNASEEDAFLSYEKRQPLSKLRLREFISPDRLHDIHRYTTTYKSGNDILPPEDVLADTRTIFVSFAAFRDVQCAPTVSDMFRKAKNPARVYVGIVQQNMPGDSDCLERDLYTPIPCYRPPANPYHEKDDSATHRSRAGTHSHDEAVSRARVYGQWATDDIVRKRLGEAQPGHGDALCFFAHNVRIRRVRSSIAMGPTFGRYMAMLAYRGESMIMVLDSHNRFRPFWDAMGVHLWHKYDDYKTVLSHYPEAYHEGTGENLERHSSAYLCRCKFLAASGLVRLSGIIIQSPSIFYSVLQYNDPYSRVKQASIIPRKNFRMPQPWVAGGFLHGNGLMAREVPHDPHLPNLFDGEEVLYGMRLWTHGYNIFSPERNLLYHFYGRATAPRFWDRNPKYYSIQRQSQQRVRYFLRAMKKDVQPPELLVGQACSDPRVVVDGPRYGLGKVRSASQWYEFAGVDPVRHTVAGKFCGVDAP